MSSVLFMGADSQLYLEVILRLKYGGIDGPDGSTHQHHTSVSQLKKRQRLRGLFYGKICSFCQSHLTRICDPNTWTNSWKVWRVSRSSSARTGRRSPTLLKHSGTPKKIQIWTANKLSKSKPVVVHLARKRISSEFILLHRRSRNMEHINACPSRLQPSLSPCHPL